MVATFAPAKQFLGMAVESVMGTAVAPSFTQLVDTLTPSDKPTFLKDQAWRGSMGTDSFNQIAGVKHAEFDLGGPVFGDGINFFLRNILGDASVTGTPTGSGSTTLSSSAVAGATSISATATIPAATLIQIGTGATAEIFTTGTPSGSGPYIIPLSTPAGGLAFGHASAQAVTPVVSAGPFTYAWSLLNSGGGQPVSHTLTHFLGPTATTQARAYPGFCLSEVDLKFNAESELYTWSGKGVSWPSIPSAALPVANGTAIKPIASWSTLVGIGGPATGGTLVNTVSDGEVDILREAVPIFTANGAQVPYIIQRGQLNVTGKLNFTAVSDESALLYMMNNTQPSVQIVTTNGLSGANLITIQIDMAQCAFVTSDPDTSKTAVGYQTSFEPVFNTTNAGGSGGQSPIKVTVTCAIVPGTF